MDSGAIALGILVYLAGAALVLLGAIAVQLRAQREGAPGGDHISLATPLDPRGPRRRGGSGGRPPRGGSGRGQDPPGSGQAYRRIFCRGTMATVWLWLLRLGVPLRHRDDLRQDIFLEAYRRLPEYDPRTGSPLQWLYPIALRLVRRHAARTPDPRLVLTPSPVSENAPDPDPDAHAQIEREEARLALLEALGTLQAELRAVVVAYDIDGLSMTIIAARCGIPIATAHRRRARALSLLRAWLASRGVT